MLTGITSILVKVLFAIIEFEFMPFIYKVVKKKKFSKRKAVFFSILNSILIYAFFLIVQYVVLSNDDKNDILIYFIVGYVCGLINYYWFKSDFNDD